MDEDATGAEIVEANEGQGLVILGDSAAIQRWLEQTDGPAAVESRDISAVLQPVSQTLAAAGTGTSTVMENSGRWIKLTEESAAELAAMGGNSGVLRDSAGKFAHVLKFEKGTLLAMPAAPAALGMILAQVALDQAMGEITSYLERIDGKLDELIQEERDWRRADLEAMLAAAEGSLAAWQATGRLTHQDWTQAMDAWRMASLTQWIAVEKINAISAWLDGAGHSRKIVKRSEVIEAELRPWLLMLAQATRLADMYLALKLVADAQEDPENLEARQVMRNEASQKMLDETRDSLQKLVNALGGSASHVEGNRHWFALDGVMVIDRLRSTQQSVVQLGAAVGAGVHGETIKEAQPLRALILDTVATIATDTVDTLVVGAESVQHATLEVLASGADATADALQTAAERLERFARNSSRDQRGENELKILPPAEKSVED